jgi:hypothetical protein
MIREDVQECLAREAMPLTYDLGQLKTLGQTG